MDIRSLTITTLQHWLQKATLVLFLLLLLDLQPTLHFATAKTSSKPLRKASRRSRVENSYFVHVRPEVNWEDAKGLMRELHLLDSDLEKPQFKATVQGAVTQLAYGFGAELSQEALEKVGYRVIRYLLILKYSAVPQSRVKYLVWVCAKSEGVKWNWGQQMHFSFNSCEYTHIFPVLFALVTCHSRHIIMMYLTCMYPRVHVCRHFKICVSVQTFWITAGESISLN